MRKDTNSVSKRIALLVGTKTGAFFYFTDENRREWRMTGPHLPGWEIDALLGDSRNGDRIFAGARPQGSTDASILVSDDFGETWTPVERSPSYPEGRGYGVTKIWQLVPGPSSEPGSFYAGAEEAGLFKSEDDGATWFEVEGLTNHPSRPGWGPGAGGLCLHTILFDPNDANRIWIALSCVGVMRSDDGGANWKVCNDGLWEVPMDLSDAPANHGIGRCAHKLALDPADPGVLYLQDHNGVFQSGDGADSWSVIEEGLHTNFGFPFCVSSAGDRYIMPQRSNEQRTMRDGQLLVYRMKRGETKWEPLNEGLPTDPRFVGVLRDALTTDALEPAGVYFGTNNGEMYASADGGDHWRQLPGRFSRIAVVKTWEPEG
jgi:hypothetical protein